MSFQINKELTKPKTDVYFQLVQDGDTITKSKVKKKIGSVKTLDIMLDGDIGDRMPMLQVFETKKLGRNKLLHEVDLNAFEPLEDNAPCDLAFTFLNFTVRGTFVVMVSRSSTSNASLNELADSPKVVAESNVESFEFVKRKGHVVYDGGKGQNSISTTQNLVKSITRERSQCRSVTAC